MPLAERFDRQAGLFDEYSALAPDVGAKVAQAVWELGDLVAGDLVLELGAGTGLIGRQFARLPVRYLGLDGSRPMLEVFQQARQDEPGSRPPLLAQADCDGRWPVADRSVAAVFASRVLHLLDADRVAGEFRRVGSPGAALIAGRVQREPHALRSRLRGLKRALLAEDGVSPPEGADGTRLVLDRCVALGAEPIDPQVVDSWTETTTAEQILAGWEASRARRGGQRFLGDPSAALAELRARACSELGDLDQPQPFTEWFVVQGVRWPDH